MLILERDKGETIIIGDEIKVTVLKVKGSQVRFGIDAPEDINISRIDAPLNSARGKTGSEST